MRATSFDLVGERSRARPVFLRPSSSVSSLNPQAFRPFQFSCRFSFRNVSTDAIGEYFLSMFLVLSHAPDATATKASIPAALPTRRR